MYFNIYTSGATKNIDPEISYGWRKAVKEEFTEFSIYNNKYSVEVFIPEDYFNYETCLPNTEKQCKSYFLNKLINSQLILVNLNESDKSIGTAQELQKATDSEIPIIGFGTTNIHPWLYDDCEVVFETLPKALEYIKNYYLI